MLSNIKYRILNLREAYRNASRNLVVMSKGKSLQIDPEFQVIDCEFEGFNRLIGNGRAYKCNFGAFTYAQYGCNLGYLTIGRFCSIGPNVIIAHGEHPTDFLSMHPIFYEHSYLKGVASFVSKTLFNSHKQVHIGSDVWIGCNCYIKDGVTIGDGAAIGAGSIVTGDIPPYSIAVGVPARVIRNRFDDKTILRLLDLKWWNWDIETISKNKELFQSHLFSGDLQAFDERMKQNEKASEF